MSARYSDGELVSTVGTPYYIAPEIITGTYSKECDI